MENNDELTVLKQKRDELLEKVLALRDKLSERLLEEKIKKKIINMDMIDKVLLQPTMSENVSPDEQHLTELNNLTQNAFGIGYKDIQKKWIKDNIWFYKTRVIMKTMNFNLDLMVNVKNDENVILDITCHFLESDPSLLQEISPWVLSLTKVKNLSYLMSAFSEFNQQYILRKKMLDKLVNNKFVSIVKCTEEGGGITAYIHSPKNIKKHYAKYNWKLQMNPKTKSINHCFLIECSDSDFMNENRDLIEDFCKSGLNKKDLKRLWADLCSVIDEY